MKKHGFINVRRGDKPPNYYRTTLVRKDFERAMAGLGPLSISQLAAILSDSVPPEAKSRYCEMCNGKYRADLPIEQVLFVGMRRVVQLRMRDLVNDGKVRKHGNGKEAKYEWIAGEGNRPQEDKAGRGHAKPKRTRPGRN